MINLIKLIVIDYHKIAINSNWRKNNNNSNNYNNNNKIA